MIDFIALSQQCAPTIHPTTMAAIVQVESAYNPYAIGVVGGRLERQPKNKEEAIATAKALEKENWNFSIGMSQVNRYQLNHFNISYDEAFDPCTNLKAGSKILEDCYMRAKSAKRDQALQAAISCYYSGNFTRGFKTERSGSSYVQKVLASSSLAIPVIYEGKKSANQQASQKNKKLDSSAVSEVAYKHNPVVFETEIEKRQQARSAVVFSQDE